MDQLDLLKKDWKRQENTHPKISRELLSKVIRKKSSSIVKWIFIISVLELVIPFIIIYISGNDSSSQHIEKIGLSLFFNIFYTIVYSVVLYFIYKFYKNYKSITANSNAKALMQNIINTRKTVRHYVWFHFALVPVITAVLLYQSLNSPDFLAKNVDDGTLIVIWLLSLVVMAVLILLLWLFYQLIYGILIKKLNRNYKELMSNGDSL